MSGRRWLRWLCRVVVVLVALVLVLFFGSNLLMRTRWFRGKIEGQLTMRTRVIWTVDEASWSPWGGGRFAHLKAVAVGEDAPTIPPLCEIAEIRVQPYWKELMAGKVRIREVRVTEPRGKLPLELLAQLMRSDGRVDAARMGAKPVVEEAAEPGPEPGRDPAAEGPDASTAGETPKAGDGTSRSARPVGDQPELPVPEEPKVERTGRLIVEGGDLELYRFSARDQSLRVRGMRMDVPFSGGDADGLLEAAEVSFGGVSMLDGVKVPVRWKEGVIVWPVKEFAWNEMTVQTAGAVRIRGRLLGTMELRVIAPKLNPRALPGWNSVMYQTGPLEMRARWTGDMLRPSTWQGNLVAGVREVQVMHRGRGESLAFEQARLVTDLRGGVLQVVDFTLAGEQLSFFGNGLMMLDGRLYGVGRVVAAPEVAEGITRVAAGAMLSPGFVPTWMSPLGTPDRYYRDIYMRGLIGQSEFDLGPDGGWMDGERAMRLMRMFVVREEAEEVVEPEGGGEGAS